LEYFYMKKTLIALAVLAASGASFAQATITGNYTFGYKQSSGGGVAQQSGIGTDTSAIKIAASEDLGGGLTAAAQVTFAGGHRSTASAVTGEDAFVKLTGGFGALTFGSIEAANGLLAIGSSGASGIGLDGKVLGGNPKVDIISYGLPLTSAFTLGVAYTDSGTTGAETGLGEGSTGTAAGQPGLTIGVTYSAGPLAAKLDTTTWARQDEVAAFTNKNRYRLSAGYDLGVVRLSAGYAQTNTTTSLTRTETLLGLKVPMGALTLGLDYAQNTKTGEHDVNGWSLGLGYALSKRTSVSTSLASWKDAGQTNAAALADTKNQFRVFVSHSF
jgi:predicted porin